MAVPALVKRFKNPEISAFCGDMVTTEHQTIRHLSRPRIVSACRKHIVIASSSACEIPFVNKEFSRVVS